MSGKIDWKELNLPAELNEILDNCPSITVIESIDQLVDLSVGGPDGDRLEVKYTLPDGRETTEAEVLRVRNGIVANYPEPYMRRRDPATMLIADQGATDQERYSERYGTDFAPVREETFDWLKQQDLALFCFCTGSRWMERYAVAVAPANAAFFALGLALLQGLMGPDDLPENFAPEAVIYIAPPFRHTHFDGKQIVVHNRRKDLYEMFSYNLYPGPSAKKGVYGMLIGLGEREGWVTAHCSTVQVVTPYDNVTTIMHEGASGGGKSEMLQHAHRRPDGRLLMGRNTVTGEERFLEISRSCDLRPVTDDMALCHPKVQQDNGKLWVTDAENAWFVRVDHITEYGTDLDLEKMTAKPDRPLLFLNIDCVPGGRAMIWEHTEDAPGQPCPNPRVVLPPRGSARRGERTGGRGRAQHGRAHPALHARKPELRHSGHAARAAARPGVALAPRLAARLRQPEHRDHRRADFGGRGQLLALRHRQEGDPGEPAARANRANGAGRAMS